MQIGNAKVDFEALVITSSAGTTAVESKVMDVLKVLADNANTVMSRDEIIDQVWGVDYGGDERLSRAISLLRKALGDGRGQHTHIETIPRRGYRLIASVKDDENAPAVPADTNEKIDVAPAIAASPALEDTPSPAPTKPLSSPLSRRSIFVGAGSLGVAALAGLALTGRLPFGGSGLLKNGIAVLPFENLSGDEGNDYLASGLSSELRTQLALNQALQVSARSSSNAMAKQSLEANEIAKRLGVANIFDGNIRIIGNDVRVTTELIDGKTGFSRWIKVFEQPLSNLLQIQSDIVDAVSEFFFADISNGSFKTSPGGTQNAAAYNEYLKGNAIYASALGSDSYIAALEHLNSAIQFDANFGYGYALRAQIYLTLGGLATNSEVAEDYFEQAMSNAQKSAQISPKLAEAHSTLGYVLYARLDVKGAKAPYEESRKLNFGDAAILARYASYMALINEDKTALEAIKRAETLDPLEPSIRRTASLVHFAARRYDAAAAAAKHVLNISPEHWNAKAVVGTAYIYSGRIEDGLRECESEPNDMERLPCQAIGYKKLGKDAEAKGAFDELVEIFGDAGAYQQVQVLAQWGDLDAAMRVFGLAVRLRDSGLTLALTDPALDPLRDRDDFSKQLAGLGFNV